MNCTKNTIAILYEHNYHYQQHLKSRVLKCIIYFLGGGGIWLDHSGFEPLKSNPSIHTSNPLVSQSILPGSVHTSNASGQFVFRS